MKEIIQKILTFFKQDIFASIFYVVIFSFILFNIVNYYIDKNEVYKDPLITVGWIIEYEEFGIGPNIYVTYEYKAKNKYFTRKIDSPNKRYSECKKNIGICKNKRFKVLYSKKNPSKSLIDFTVEVQDSNIITIPKSLKNFQ